MTIAPGRAGKKRGVLIVTLVLCASMGPYVARGLRTEQLAVYGAAGLIFAVVTALVRPTPMLIKVATAWAAYVAVALIGGLWAPQNVSHYPRGSSAAGLDNAALPLAAMLLVTCILAFGGDPVTLARRAAAVVVALMCLNSVASFMQFRFGYDWSTWYGNDPTQQTVSALAAQLGRYSGLFNQPAEAGVLYSVAGLCAVYVLARRPVLLTVAIVLIVAGGVLTVSKIFLLGGLPLVALAVVRESTGRAKRLSVVSMAAIAAWGLASQGYLPAWTGGSFLLRLIPNSQDNLVVLFTANRYSSGGTGTLQYVREAVLNGPWAFGYGSGGLAVPYDSGWIEALVVGGVVGVALQAVVFGVLAWAWRSAPGSRERTLFGGIVLILLGGSLGLPTLTANRVATMVWILLTLLLMVPTLRRGQGADAVVLSDAQDSSTTEATSTR